MCVSVGGKRADLRRRAFSRIVVAMNHDAVVAFIDEVRAAADIVQVGRIALPVLHLR